MIDFIWISCESCSDCSYKRLSRHRFASSPIEYPKIKIAGLTQLDQIEKVPEILYANKKNLND